jgi:hypothetical protein
MSFSSAESESTGQPPVALASLGLAIAGLATFLCFLGLPLSVAAVVTGVIGRIEARRRGVTETPATAGLIIGAATLVLAILIAAIS